MNVLAHLHIAKRVKSSVIGNTLADFVKGNPDKVYQTVIADGIKLHRKVDMLTDTMQEVKRAKSLFRKTHQRVAPITLDIVWDHFLSKNWNNYCSMCSLHEFNLITRQEIEPTITAYPMEYQRFMSALWQGSWLENYAELGFIGKVLNGMANRRPKLYLLRETTIDIEQNYDELEGLFKALYPKLLLTVKNSTLTMSK